MGKHAVEQMMRQASAPADGLLGELDQVREAVTGPLSRVVGAGQDVGWVALVDRAAEVAGWDRPRWAALRVAVEPERLEDPAATLEALWGLATELNERRELERAGPGDEPAR